MGIYQVKSGYDWSLSEKYNDYVTPDDVIVVDVNFHIKTMSLWSPNVKEAVDNGLIPAESPPIDLMLAKTIPLPNFFMKFDDQTIVFNTFDTGVMFSNGVLICWATIKENGHWKIEIKRYDTGDIYIPQMDADKFELFMYSLLDMWYGIQVLLLNPQCHSLMKNPTKEKIYTRVGTGKDRKRVVKYIRKHYITAEGIDEALYGHGHRDFKRKTMAWYVIGHWRQYKNGTRKFINGYWKGPLRGMKRNLDGGRIRQLAIQEA